MSLFYSVIRTKSSDQVRGKCSLTKPVFTAMIFQHLAQSPSWRTTPCPLSATAYSIYSQLPSILEAIPLSATWGRAMPWWQGPTYHGQRITCVNCKGWCRTWFCSGLQQCHQIRLERERGKPPQIINILDEMRTSSLPNVSQKVKHLNDVQITLIFSGQQKNVRIIDTPASSSYPATIFLVYLHIRWWFSWQICRSVGPLLWTDNGEARKDKVHSMTTHDGTERN